MKRYPDYYRRRQETNALLNSVRDDLGKTNGEYVTDIELGWQSRFLGVLRHSFYTGYRHALSIIDENQPGATYSIMDKILVTEHDLCFTRTVEERERE